MEETKESIKLAVKAKPEKGEANREVIKFLSEYFRKKVRIVRGLKSKNKVIVFESQE